VTFGNDDYIVLEKKKKERKANSVQSIAASTPALIGLLTPLFLSALCSTLCNATPYVKRREAFATVG